MGGWSPAQYLRFGEERTRPCRDLVARVELPLVRKILDLGCGPANSTRVLHDRWPDAEITGLDSSEEMIERARRDMPDANFVRADIVEWAESEGARFDLVFSNAALQWVRGHEVLFPMLFGRVKPGGVLAVQLPARTGAPAQRLISEIAAPLVTRPVRDWHSHDAGFYYDTMAPLAGRLEIWETEYLHVLANAGEIVEFYKGTALRPYLAAMPGEAVREQFLLEYRTAVTAAYPARADGKVLFPFRRIFVMAYRVG